jgi:hypothetical protein
MLQIEDSLMDWQFNEDYNELLRELGIFISGYSADWQVSNGILSGLMKGTFAWLGSFRRFAQKLLR